MSDIAVLEKIVIVHVWEEEELDYETSEAYLIFVNQNGFVNSHENGVGRMVR